MKKIFSQIPRQHAGRQCHLRISIRTLIFFPYRRLFECFNVRGMKANGSSDDHFDILSMTPSVRELLDQVRELQEVARTGTEQDLLKHLNRAGWVPPIIRMSAPEPWVGTAEVARLLGQTQSWVRSKSSLMPHIRIGPRYRFRLSEIEGWYKQWFAGERMDFMAYELGMNPSTMPRRL